MLLYHQSICCRKCAALYEKRSVTRSPCHGMKQASDARVKHTAGLLSSSGINLLAAKRLLVLLSPAKRESGKSVSTQHAPSLTLSVLSCLSLHLSPPLLSLVSAWQQIADDNEKQFVIFCHRHRLGVIVAAIIVIICDLRVPQCLALYSLLLLQVPLMQGERCWHCDDGDEDKRG